MNIAQKIAAIKHCYTSTTCVGCPANPTPDSCMPDKCLCNINDAVLEVLDKFDTEVAVKHGKWGFDGTGWTCSECDSYGDERYKYCPHCGAKMDGGAYD